MDSNYIQQVFIIGVSLIHISVEHSLLRAFYDPIYLSNQTIVKQSTVNPDENYLPYRFGIRGELNDPEFGDPSNVIDGVDVWKAEDYRRLRLRYLISSTAEQPDSGGRSSNFSIWLTLIIAALAAAILS